MRSGLSHSQNTHTPRPPLPEPTASSSAQAREEGSWPEKGEISKGKGQTPS